jgi:ABC-type transporter Mla subunit MlaD
MLSEKKRNTLVGLTIILALGALMYGILLLGKTPTWTGLNPYTITLVADNANGVAGGDKVDLNGVVIGQVQSVDLKIDGTGKLKAYIVLQIGGSNDIPANAHAVLGNPKLGSPYVSLSVSEAEGGNLAKNGSAAIPAETGESGLIPKDIQDNLTAVSHQLEQVANDLHTLLAYNTPEAVAAGSKDPTNPNRPLDNISTLVIRLDRTMASLETLLTDPKLQGQVREIAQNLSDASAKLKITLAGVDSVVKHADQAVSRFGDTAGQANATLASTQQQILRVSEKLVDTLDQIQKSTREITEGKGTTGRLVSDPRLYDGLLDLSKSLRATTDDLDFLLKKWKDEGVDLKLK